MVATDMDTDEPLGGVREHGGAPMQFSVAALRATRAAALASKRALRVSTAATAVAAAPTATAAATNANAAAVAAAAFDAAAEAGADDATAAASAFAAASLSTPGAVADFIASAVGDDDSAMPPPQQPAKEGADPAGPAMGEGDKKATSELERVFKKEDFKRMKIVGKAILVSHFLSGT